MQVQQERAQHPWRMLVAALDDNEGGLDPSTRAALTAESFTTQRWRKFCELMKEDSSHNYTDEQIKQWHRMWNDNLCFLADVNKKIVSQRRRLDELEEREHFREQVRLGEKSDMMSQTPLTCVTGERPRKLPQREHGARMHVNAFSSRRGRILNVFLWFRTLRSPLQKALACVNELTHI